MELPLELWHQISLSLEGKNHSTSAAGHSGAASACIDPGPYWVLVRTAKKFALLGAKTLLRRVESDPYQVTLPNGHIHCDTGPAVILRGDSIWYQDNVIAHMNSLLPAVVDANGTLRWYKNGVCHRDHLPALVYADGTSAWLQEGKLHRDNDLPAVICADGHRQWYQRGQLERSYGPAIIYGFHEQGPLNREKFRSNLRPDVYYPAGSMQWYQRGELHRGDGLPALSCPNGLASWYLSGRYFRDTTLPVHMGANGEQWWKTELMG